MNETFPEPKREELKSNGLIGKRQISTDMETRAIHSASIRPEEKDILIESINDKIYPAGLVKKVHSKAGKEVLTILATESLTPETLSELKRRIAISTNINDETGQNVITTEEAVALYMLMDTLDTPKQ